MLEGFEKFTKAGRSFQPKVSIRKRGQIGFNNGAINRFELEKFDFVVCYYNKEEKKIAFKFINDVNEEGAIKIAKSKGNFFFSGKSFLDYYDIDYSKTHTHEMVWNEEHQMVFVDLAEDELPDAEE